MAELKRKRDAATGSGNASADSSEGSNSPNNTESNREESKDEPGAMVCGESACAGESKTQRRKKSKKASTDREEGSPPGDSEGRAEVSQADPEASSGVLEVTQSQKSKKKSKKDQKKQDTSVHEADMNEVHGENSPMDTQPISDTGKKRRKKSKKRKSTEPGELEEKGSNNTSILRCESDSRTRRRKSVRFSVGADEVFTIPGKEESTPEDTVQQEEESLPMEEEKVSKKKKKRIKMEEAVELEAEVSEKMKKREEAIEEKVSKNKRKKKAATEEEASSKRKREATEEEASAKRKKREEATEENISVKNGEAVTEGEILTVRKTEKAMEEKASRKKKKKKKREEATEEEASAERKKKEEAEEEKVSTKKGEEATEGEVLAKKKSEKAVKETVSKKKTEEVDGENVSRKREREETHSEEEGPPESKKPRVNKPAAVVSSCVKAELEGRKDSVLPTPQKTQSTPVNDVPCSQRSMVKMRAVKKPAKLSQDHIDRIHQRFEGTNLNCFGGYGQWWDRKKEFWMFLPMEMVDKMCNHIRLVFGSLYDFFTHTHIHTLSLSLSLSLKKDSTLQLTLHLLSSPL